MVGKLYVLKVVPDKHGHVAMDESSLKLWHYRLGHLETNTSRQFQKI